MRLLSIGSLESTCAQTLAAVGNDAWSRSRFWFPVSHQLQAGAGLAGMPSVAAREGGLEVDPDEDAFLSNIDFDAVEAGQTRQIRFEDSANVA
eukprot:scaffold46180_cov15-Tisochrysis_lutea.AAC.1